MHPIPFLPLLILGLFAFAAPLTSAAPSPIVHQVHEARDRVPLGWTRRSRVGRTFEIPMSIALTQSNLHRLEDYLNEVSHPQSGKYGKVSC